MKPLGALAGALLLALLAVTFALPPARALTTVEASPGGAGVDGGERLARAVRYSAPFRLARASAVRVHVEGNHGGVLLSLVDDEDRVRELALDPGDAETAFAGVAPGSFRLRVLARPPERGSPAPLRIQARTGGRPWALFAVAALLVLVPVGMSALRRRRGDGGRRNG
ncbi:MAG: hypothetical protein CMN30_13090 [Sandaracinus sp.]|nr:hypothetical protein [Sandaracinus sp.]